MTQSDLTGGSCANRAIALMKTHDRGEAVRHALRGVEGLDLDVRVGPLVQVLSEVDGRAADAVVIADVDPADEAEVTVLTWAVRQAGPRTAFLATADGATVDLVRRMMRNGIVDVIPHPLEARDLVSGLQVAIGKLAPDRSESQGQGKVVSVMRSCGGAGATTIAVQAGVELLADRKAKKGRRNRVCLLDFDVQFGSAALALDLQERAGLRQILESPSRLDGTFLSSAMSHHPSGLDVLAAPEAIVPIEALTADLALKIVNLARRQYDFVLVDLPHAWASWTAPLLGTSDLVALVTLVDVAGVHRCRKQLNLVGEQELDDVPLVVVANRFVGGWGAGGRLRRAQAALGRKIDHAVRLDGRAAGEARDRGVPIRDVARSSVVVKDVRAMVDRSIRPLSAAAPPQTADASSKGV